MFFYGFKITAPTVFSVFVIYRTEMHLQEYFVPAITYSFAYRSIGSACSTKVEKIDSVVNGFADNCFNFINRCLSDSAHSKTKYAEFFVFISVRQLSVFHVAPRQILIHHPHYTTHKTKKATVHPILLLLNRLYYAASFSVVLISVVLITFTEMLLYRIMPIITEIRDIDSLNIPLYECANKL